MASTNAIRAGQAFVEILADDSQARRVLIRFERRMTAFAATIQSVGVKMLGLGTAMLAPFAATVKAASDAAETANKFAAVFGTQTAAASEFIKQLAADVGRSSVDIQDSMSSFQAMLVGLNFDPAQAREMSQSLQSLAIDFGSFFNVSDKEATERFLSALSGSSEVLDKFGINIKAAALDQKFLAMGLNVTTANASEQQKVMARTSIIMEAMTAQGAVGDAVKTSGSFANQLKRLQAGLKDTAVAIGSAVIPVLTPLLSKLNTAVGMVSAFIQNNDALIKTVFLIAVGVAGAGAALIGLAGAIRLVGFAVQPVLLLMTGFKLIVGGIASVFSLVASAIGFVLTPVGLLTAAIIGIAGYMLYASGVFEKAVQGWGGLWSDLTSTMTTSWKAVSDAISAGDLSLAFEIITTTAKLLFQQAVNYVMPLWNTAANFFMDVWDQASTTIAKLLIDSFTSIRTIWNGVVSFFRIGWDIFAEAAITALTAAQNATAVMLVPVMAKIFQVDPEEMKKTLAEMQAAEAAALENAPETIARRQRLAKGFNALDKQNAAATQEGEDTKALLESEKNQRAADRAGAADAGAAEGQKNANRLMHRLDILRFQAADALAEAQTAKPGEKFSSRMPSFAGMGDLSGLKTTVIGTFSAAAASGLAAGDTVASRTANATEKSAALLEKIENKKPGGLGK